MAHYRITPLEKKSIEVFYELYKQDPETGVTKWINITELYRWGQAFIAEDMDCNLPYKGDDKAYCRMEEGEHEGCEFDDSIAINFEFSDDIDTAEQDSIKEAYYEGNASWLYDGDHGWEIEDDYVIVYGPYKVEFCEEDGTVIKEVELLDRPAPSTAWPFSTDFPKPEEA